MKNIIIISTYVKTARFLENLLFSFKGYSKYPILLVITGFKKEHLAPFLKIEKKFHKLPIDIKTIHKDTFEFGGLYVAYKETNYDNLLLLQDTCEIVNTDLFDIVFEKYQDKSVAFSIVNGFWMCCIAKYKRSILDKIDMEKFLPHNRLEAFETEWRFTQAYSRLEKDAVILFKDWVDCNVFEEKYGRINMKIANEYIIKWKAHWNPTGPEFDKYKKKNS